VRGSISEEEIHTGYVSSEKIVDECSSRSETNIYKLGISAFSTASKEKKSPKRKRSEKSSKKKSAKSKMSSISEKSDQVSASEVFSTTTEEIMTEMTAGDYIFPLDEDGDELDCYNFDAFKERKLPKGKWWE